jgi:hypothetical protein
MCIAHTCICQINLSRIGFLGSWTSALRSSRKFAYIIAIWKLGLILAVAVMFADGPLVLLVRYHMGVREVRRALHALLVHP